LTRALAHQATLAIQLTRLSAQSRQSAVMAERNRMARDIHDTLAQGFTGVIVQLEAVEEAMSKDQAGKPPAIWIELENSPARACAKRGARCRRSAHKRWRRNS
jgi:nitrate/nitrite-specific signal transduction histidine kinase